jgi:thymidylate synthase (FAD)
MTGNNMEVTLIDVMGSDISVVNAARVSFKKESKYTIDETGAMTLKQGDAKLVDYLANHNHFTPFCHAFASFRIKAPIFVARQLVKHQVGLAWNEVSRRYVSDSPEYYLPHTWRKAAENVKQGSSDEPFTFKDGQLNRIYEALVRLNSEYESLIADGLCAEQARMILPQNMMTEWVWSGSLFAFARVCNLRCDPHTQAETRVVADKIDMLMVEEFPHTWSALRETSN